MKLFLILFLLLSQTLLIAQDYRGDLGVVNSSNKNIRVTIYLKSIPFEGIVNSSQSPYNFTNVKRMVLIK